MATFLFVNINNTLLLLLGNPISKKYQNIHLILNITFCSWSFLLILLKVDLKIPLPIVITCSPKHMNFARTNDPYEPYTKLVMSRKIFVSFR